MSRMVLLSVSALLLSACTSSWDPVDHDGDGISALDGDCWDALDGPQGSGLAGADIFPGAAETFYDGIDQDCAFDDDFDADADGYVPDEHTGVTTLGVTDSGGLPAGDCWDDPAASPPLYTVVASGLTDKVGNQLDWAQPTAFETNPDGIDTWYDGVDQDCAGDDDFDQDGDGFATESYPDQSGTYGDDCVDGNELDDENFAGDAAVDVNPDAAERWYDGTDQDCDDNDCDQDEDGWDGPTDDSATEYCYPEECEDSDPDIYPDDSIPEVWYNGVDENCDGNDGDQDGDGYWTGDYDAQVLASGTGEDPLTIPEGWDGDCWDVPLSVEAAPSAFTALNDFDQPDADEVNADAAEVWYDGIDQDCAGNVSDFDSDGDSYDTMVYPNDGDALYGIDCDDVDGTVFPGQFETFYDGTDDNCDGNDGDADGDGYWSADYETLVNAAGGTPLDVPEDCGDTGALPCDGDCDDGNSDVHPDRLEDCRTTQDDDCDGDTNFDAEESPGVAGDAISCTEYYQDDDRDSFGDLSGASICYCDAYDDYDVLTNTDCDDSDDDTYPGADEYCDGHDDDCDGDTDEDSSVDALTWYADTDGDSYGDPAVTDIECYQPSGYELDNTDCDDARALTNPGATEYCNEIHDDDCDGTIDEPDAADAPTWYHDADNDDYGDPLDSRVQCELYQPTGYIADNTDCDDTDSGDYPGAPEIIANADDEDCDGGDTCYEDLDLDGFGSSLTLLSADVDCADSGESYTSNDCDDSAATTYPAADEYCDGHDDDCDGEVDEDGSVDVLTWYADSDGDLYGNLAVPDTDCYQPTGYVADATDCDDTDSGDYPGATEIVGNQDDEDCDGGEICYDDDDNDGYLDTTGDTLTSADADCVDTYEGTNSDPTTDCDDTDSGDYPGATEVVGNEDDEDCNGGEICYHDDDNDGYLDSSGDTVVSSDTDCTDSYEGTNSDPTTDCDDADSGDYPGATEIVGNEDDEDCDGGEICYDDDDNDGYLDTTGDTRTSSDTDCTDNFEGSTSTLTTDCDDSDGGAYPGATEYCDGHDNDCNGQVDEDTSDDVLTWYADSDSDSYGDVSSPDIDCYQPSGYVADNTDCDDSDSGDYPGAPETVGNGDDEDCDGAEICYDDDDNDGFLDSTGDTRTSSDSDCNDAYEGKTTDLTTDCDDADAGDYPGATETVGNGDDEDCDGGEICYDDDDNDGFLDSSGDTRVSSDTDCSDAYEGTDTDLTTDCDDDVASVYPGATEVVADGIDQDCANGDTCYEDNDLDGYGSTGLQVSVDLDCSDSGEASVSTDCDDSNGAAYPGAAEVVADGVDQSCSGGDTCYSDGDLDGYGSTSTTTSTDLDCSDSGEATVNTDCDDAVAAVNPGESEIVADGIDQNCSGGDTCYEDNDLDGFGSTGTQASVDTDCTDPGEATTTTDCDDADGDQYPGADELCNGEDDDCDGTTDEDSAVDVTTWYLDYDGDLYGDSAFSDIGCEQPTGYVLADTETDCDDADSTSNPGETEIVGNEVDNDCDGGEICYKDLDGDGYGTTSTKTSSDSDCGDSQESTVSTDCDDTGSGADLINPAATEVCDDVDNDCDSLIDDADGSLDTGTATTWWVDSDTDGYGVSSLTSLTCDAPSGYVDSAAGTDCDDGDIAINPDATEVCDSVDNDCDGDIDDDDLSLDTGTATTWYADVDVDTYGDAGSTQLACDQPSGYLTDSDDCLDSDAGVYPGALEICDDGLINDCDETGGGTSGNACPAVGALVISEIMANPSILSDTSGEWFELYNSSGSDIDLEGLLILDDGSDSHQIASSVVVAAGDFVVLGKTTSATRSPDYDYSSITLSQSGTDELVIKTWGTTGSDGTEIDRVDYDTGGSWSISAGESLALLSTAMTASDNDSVSNWAAATCYYNIDNAGTGLDVDMGTPGGANNLACPLIDQLDPSEVLLDTTETVTITGTDLVYSSADVVVVMGDWDTDIELTPSSTSSTEVEFTASSSSVQGTDDIVVYNGINLAILEDAINYVDLDIAYLWWPIPSTHAAYGIDYVPDSLGGLTLEAGETTGQIYGRVEAVGIGHCTIEPAMLAAELGYGPAGSDPRYDAWTWSTATFNSLPLDCTIWNSEYEGNFSSLVAGTYDFTFRFQYDGGPWLYGEFRGDYPYTDTEGPSGYAPGEVFDLSQIGTFTVNP